MSVTAEDLAPRRTRGRPPTRSDAETRHLIAEAARGVFMLKGFAGTSIEDVAKAAGLSKKTLYRVMPTKAALFKASITDRIARFILAVEPAALDKLPVQDALERFMVEFGALTLSEETIALHKLVLAESDRFPELAADFFKEAIMATQGVLADYLERQVAKGTIALDDPFTAAGLLRGMMAMEPQRAVMMGQRAVPSETEVLARARLCAGIFLRGCLTTGA